MTEQEQAEQIKQMFQSVVLDESNYPNIHHPTLTDSEATKFAIIYVKGIIEELEMIITDQTSPDSVMGEYIVSRIKFWQSVLNHLEKK